MRLVLSFVYLDICHYLTQSEERPRVSGSAESSVDADGRLVS